MSESRCFCFCWGFLKLARVRKCRPFFFLVAKAGIIVLGGRNGKRGNWERELNRVLVLREQQLQNVVFCKESFVFTCLTTVHEFYGLKASQMSKVRASSHEYPDAEEIKNLCEQSFKGHSTKRLQ